MRRKRGEMESRFGLRIQERPVSRLTRELVIAFLCVLSLVGAARSEDIRVSIEPETTTVGEPVRVQVEVDAPPGAEVAFQKPRLSRWAELLGQPTTQAPGENPRGKRGSRRADRGGGVSQNTWVATFTLALFSVGEVVLPPVAMQIQVDSRITEAQTDSLRFFVSTLLDDSLAAAPIADLKPLEEIPQPVPLWVWIGLAVLVVSGLLWWLLRRRRRQLQLPPVAPPIPVHQWALRELEKLELQRLPFEQRIKEHYVRLSEILRSYLERSPRFGFTALEETTEEILRELRRREFEASIQEALKRMCEEADLVKFAKHEPTVEECNESLERVRRFVMQMAHPEGTEQREAVLVPSEAS